MLYDGCLLYDGWLVILTAGAGVTNVFLARGHDDYPSHNIPKDTEKREYDLLGTRGSMVPLARK